MLRTGGMPQGKQPRQPWRFLHMLSKLKCRMSDAKGSIKCFIQENRAFFAWMMLFSVVVYFKLMSEELVNCYDGIWEGSYHQAGAWELSLGRWLWCYIDILRLGVSSDPVTSLITLASYSLGLTFCFDLLGSKRAFASYLAGGLFLCSQAVLITLSYRYMSPTFGIAFLLGMLGVWLCARLKSFVWGLLAGSVFICLSLGAYQAFIGCICLAMIGWIITKAREGVPNVFLLLAKGVCTVLLGGIEYLVMWNLHLWFFHVEKSSYAGADTYSFLNTFLKLPERILAVLQYFSLYFKDILCNTLRFGDAKLYLLFFILAAAIIAADIWCVFKRKKVNGIIYLLLAAVVPIAAGAVLLAATETHLSVQMTGAYALLIPVLLQLLSAAENKAIVPKLLNIAASLVAVIILYASFLQVQVDQKTMSETRTSSMNVVAEIHERLGAENLLSENLRYCFIGIPAGNPMYYRSETFWDANGYTYIGGGWTDPASITKSWNGLIKDICQININICPANEYDMLSQDDNVDSMPVFPAEGSIMRIGDIVVIRVS